MSTADDADVRPRDAAAHALRLAWSSAPRTTSAFACTLVVVALVPLVVAWSMKTLVDGLGDGAPTQDLVAVAAVLALAGLAGAWVPRWQAFLQAQLHRSVAKVSLVRLYEAVNRLPGLARFESPGFLDRLRMAQQSTTGAPATVVQLVLGITAGSLTIGGFMVSLGAVSPPMLLVVLLGSVPVLLAELLLARNRATTMWHVTPAQRRELVYGMLLTDMQAAKEIRLYGLGAFLLRRIVRERDSADGEQRRIDRRELHVQGWLSLLSAAVAGGGLLWAVLEASAGRLGIGDLTLFVAAVAGVQAAVSAMIQQVSALHENVLVYGHFVAVLRTPPDLPVAAPPARLPRLGAEIRLEGVWFRYADDLPWVLRGVDLVLPAGSSLALVGVNGAGKSTLVKLLCRFYDPTRGRITWDGVDLRDVAPEDLRARLATVFQDFVQFDLTARENISVGAIEHAQDDERIVRAARQAGVDATIDRLPRGLDTHLTRLVMGLDGDEATGVPLSGGQWQRLALARAFLREEADLLILDEPSAGLDAAAELELHRSVATLRAGRTGLLISHRLSAVRDADEIVVLDEGTIAERGSHDALLAAGGTYAALFELQRSGYADDAVGHEVLDGAVLDRAADMTVDAPA